MVRFLFGRKFFYFFNLKKKLFFQFFYSTINQVKSIIFDFDGVIIDSETVYYKINEQVLNHFGIKYSMELKRGQMGRNLNEGINYLLKTTKLDLKGIKFEVYFFN
jgi:phosphoglycolate phosphatase-like HAD superfamily hydrolase